VFFGLNLRLGFSILISILFFLLFFAFSLFLFSQIKSKALEEADRSLKEFTQHEWEHLDLPSHQEGGHEDSGHFKNVFIRVWKENSLLFDSFPKNQNISFGSGFDPQQKKIFHSLEGMHEGSHYSVKGYYDVSLLLRSLALFQKILLVGCVLMGFLILPLSWLLSRQLLKPFQFLANKTSQLKAEDLDFRFPQPPVLDEYGLLAKNFNDLFDRLEISFSQVKNFALQASHEIRTPVAVLISQLERAKRKPSSDLVKISELHEKLLSTSLHLRNILNRLFLMTEIEPTEKKEDQRVEFKVKGSIERVISDLKDVYHPLTKEIRTSFSAEDLTHLGNPDVFEIALLNLIENAIKYSSQVVSVSVLQREGSLEILVEDDGLGLSTGNQKKVSEGGSRGLGLSIVQACLKAENARLLFDKSPLGGLSVRLVFS